jgi:hypothetical protein
MFGCAAASVWTQASIPAHELRAFVRRSASLSRCASCADAWHSSDGAVPPTRREGFTTCRRRQRWVVLCPGAAANGCHAPGVPPGASALARESAAARLESACRPRKGACVSLRCARQLFTVSHADPTAPAPRMQRIGTAERAVTTRVRGRVLARHVSHWRRVLRAVQKERQLRMRCAPPPPASIYARPHCACVLQAAVERHASRARPHSPASRRAPSRRAAMEGQAGDWCDAAAHTARARDLSLTHARAHARPSLLQRASRSARPTRSVRA